MSRDAFESVDLGAPVDDGRVAEAARQRVEQGGSRAYIVDTRDGTVGTVPAEEAASALSTGRFRLPTAEEQQRAGQTEEFADRGVLAAGQAAINIGGALTTERSQALAAENETAATVGALGRDLILGGGVGGLVRGGAGAAATLGRRVLAGAAEGAVATAASSDALSLDREGDAALNGESILASLGGSIMLGGSLGAAFELGAAGLGSVGRRLMRSGDRGAAATRDALGSLVERTTGREAAPGVADALLERLGRAGTTGLDEADAAFVRRGLALTDEGRALRQVIDRGDAIIDDSLRPLRSQIDDLQQVARRTADEAGGELKRGQISRLVRPSALAEAGEDIAGFSGSVREMAEMLRNAPGATGARGMANRLDEMAAFADDAIERSLGSGGREGATDAFIALDQLKRRYGREVARARRSMGLRDVVPELESVYETGRRFLEREDLFGGAALAQKEINSAWSDLLSTSRQFRRRFLSDAGEQEGFESLLTADPRKLDSFLRSTGTAQGALDDEIFENYLARQQRFNQAVGNNYELDDAMRGAYSQADETLSALNQTRDSIRSSVGARNQFAEVSERLGERAGLLSGGGLAVGGAVAGGIPGLAIGGLASVVSRPDRAIRMLASVERMTQTFRGRLQSRSRDFVERIARPGGVERLARSGGGNRNAIRGAVVGMTAAEVADRFDRLTETIEKNGDTPAMVERLADRTVDLGDAAPQTATMLTAAVVRAQQYLQSQLPPLAYNVPAPLGAPSTRASQRVTEDEQRAMLRTAETIEDPLRVLEEAGRGMLTAEHTETLRVVYPSLHRELVTTVTETIADRDEPLPYSGRLTVSLLLGIPTDPSLSGEAIASAQAGHAGPQPTDPGGPAAPLLTPGNRRAPETVSIYQTTTQRIRS